jgi:hypothetical protein
MFDGRAAAKGFIPFLFALVWSGCDPTGAGPGPWEPVYSIAGFTLFNDSTIAVQLDLREERSLSSGRPERRRERTAFASINLYRNDIHPLTGDLPLSARAGLPGFFMACREETPVSLSPGGPKGTRGDCQGRSLGISNGGMLVVFGSDAGAFQVLDADLKPLLRVPAPPSGWKAILAADEDSGFVTVLRDFPDNRGYWLRYSLYDRGAVDSAYLIWPTMVRIAGYGARVLCSEIDEEYGYPACWHPRGEPGFADAARRFCASDCEWNPATGMLLARTNYHGRFVYVQPSTGTEQYIEANPTLDSLLRAGAFP